MDILGRILGFDDRSDSITDLIRGASRWVFSCGCMIVLVLIAGIVLIINGNIVIDSEAMSVIVVIGTMIVAILSLIRTSLEGRHYR